VKNIFPKPKKSWLGKRKKDGKRMTLKITTICENKVMKEELMGEHGLSFLIEYKGKRFLLDTGSGLTFRHNAEKLQLDLSSLDGIIISHGHFDHTGGLKDVLEAAGPLKVYAHPGIFDAKYKVIAGKDELQYIGIPFSRQELEELGASFSLSRGPVEIVKGLTLSGEITRQDPKEGYEESFVKKIGEKIEHDPLLDDQAVIIDLPQGAVVVMGCAHSGPLNIVKQVLAGGDVARVAAVIGGLHLFRSDENRIKQTVASLAELGVNYISPCHCTGFKAEAAFLQVFGSRFQPNSVGVSLDLEKFSP